jgi:hypothetical protein
MRDESFLSRTLRLALCATGVCLTLLPAAANAQANRERVIWRSLLGATAVDLRAATGIVRLGLADDAGPMTLEMRAADVRRFADSSLKLLASRRRARPWVVRLDESGGREGLVSVSHDPEADSERPYLFFASEDAVRQIRERLTTAEARMLLQRFRSAAVTATPRPAPRRRPNAERPAPG